MLSYVCNQRRDIDCTGGVNGWCLWRRIGQAIVALVTDWQTARNQLTAPYRRRLSLPAVAVRQASRESGWAARFSSEV